MAVRPTAAKLTKLGTDLDKITSRLFKEATAITSYRSNPLGTDMQIVAGLAPVEEKVRAAAQLLREAEAELQTPLRTVVNRKKPKA